MKQPQLNKWTIQVFIKNKTFRLAFYHSIHHLISNLPTGKHKMIKRIVKKASILLYYFICAKKVSSSNHGNLPEKNLLTMRSRGFPAAEGRLCV